MIIIIIIIYYKSSARRKMHCKNRVRRPKKKRITNITI